MWRRGSANIGRLHRQDGATRAHHGASWHNIMWSIAASMHYIMWQPACPITDPTSAGRVWGRGAGLPGEPHQDNKPRYALPNFRNRIRAHRKNFETGPRLSNSLPQESQIAPWLPARVTPPVPRLPPGAGRTLGGPALQPPDCVRSGPTALWRVQRDSYTSPAGPCQVGHIEELPDMPRARLGDFLQGFAASAAPSPT